MIEVVKEALKYGTGGVAVFGVIWLLYLFYKLERRMFKHEENYKDIEITCSKRSIHFTDAFTRIEKLERKAVGDDVRFDNIDDKLVVIGDNVTKIVDHFVSKGMKQ